MQEVRNAIDDLIGYETDNSCSDPDCCGGPYYEKVDFDAAVKTLSDFGIAYYE